MIVAGDLFTLPREAGARFLAREPFRAIAHTDEAGRIRRPPPFALLRPFGGHEQAAVLMEHDRVEAAVVFAAEIPNGVLAGQRAVVAGDPGVLFTDSRHPQHTAAIFKEEERRRFEFVPLDQAGDGYAWRADAPPPVALRGEVVALTAMEHDNYGAFLLRLLPKLILIRQLGLLRSILLAPVDGWQGRVLRALGVAVDQAVPYDKRRSYRADRLILPSLRTSEFFVDDGTANFFQDIARRLCRGQGGADGARRPEKLYVSRLAQGRKHPDHRLMVNEQQLADALAARGFHVFEPEAHSFEEQVRSFAAARIVVGPSGAGMFNTVFCRPDAVVVSIEPMLNWLVLHANMYASMGHPYALVVGGADETDPGIQKRWRADVDCVTGLVDRLLA